MIKKIARLAYIAIIVPLSIKSSASLIQSLHDHHIIQHGSFMLKSGKTSSTYIDMRNAISSPQLLSATAQAMNTIIPNSTYDCICGVPHGAVPLATTLSLQRNEPLIMLRKEIKNHGTQKRVEGIYKNGDHVLLVEDVITTGSSILEAITLLEECGLIIKDVIVFLDRQEGGVEKLKNLGYSVHAVYTLSEILSYQPKKSDASHHLTYAQRAQLSTNQVTQKLFAIMEEKKTNLACAADVSTTQELINLADTIGPHICLLKVHIDILTDFDPTCITKLKNLACKHNFLLMEDRKFADIGNTTQLQYTQGIYAIAEWADLVTVHTIAGSDILTHMKNVVDTSNRAAILIAQMSSKNNLTDAQYIQRTYAIGDEHQDIVAGFVTQSSPANTTHIVMTPGIHLTTRDIADQQYTTPYKAIYENNSDIIIVGRAIYNAQNPLAAALAYKDAGWLAYKERAQI